MNIIEKNIPYSVTVIINLLALAVFIPILLYAVYQTVTLVGHANEEKINITVDAKNLNTSVNNLNFPQKNTTPISKNTIISMMNELTGQRLLIDGETDTVKAYAAKNENVISVLAMNYALPEKGVKIVPLTIENLTPGKYRTQVEYSLETGCAINDPPDGNPPKTISISDYLISINTCLTSGNAVLWKLTKL